MPRRYLKQIFWYFREHEQAWPVAKVTQVLGGHIQYSLGHILYKKVQDVLRQHTRYVVAHNRVSLARSVPDGVPMSGQCDLLTTSMLRSVLAFWKSLEREARENGFTEKIHAGLTKPNGTPFLAPTNTPYRAARRSRRLQRGSPSRDLGALSARLFKERVQRIRGCKSDAKRSRSQGDRTL